MQFHPPSAPTGASVPLQSSRPRRGTLALLTAALVLALGLTRLRADPAPSVPPACQSFDHTHAAWSALLSRYVRAGVVDYSGWKATGMPALESYLTQLSTLCPEHYAQFTRAQRLAFWINAYNAYTIRLMLQHYPIASIRALGVLPGAAFRERFIPVRVAGSPPLSLNDLEHEQLRKALKEPRIHFAIVCASKSCPSLRAEAYRAVDIEAQLDDAARDFVGDPSKNRLDTQRGTVELSAIFDWFAGDFERAAGSVPAFVARYAPADQAALLRRPGLSIGHLDYDWTLNGR